MNDIFEPLSKVTSERFPVEEGSGRSVFVSTRWATDGDVSGFVDRQVSVFCL